MGFVHSCLDPIDYIPRRSYPLFLAREAINEMLGPVDRRVVNSKVPSETEVGNAGEKTPEG